MRNGGRGQGGVQGWGYKGWGIGLTLETLQLRETHPGLVKEMQLWSVVLGVIKQKINKKKKHTLKSTFVVYWDVTDH